MKRLSMNRTETSVISGKSSINLNRNKNNNWVKNSSKSSSSWEKYSAVSSKFMKIKKYEPVILTKEELLQSVA